MEPENFDKNLTGSNDKQIPPLSKRAVTGGAWVFALRISNRSLDFIRTIILARLLSPTDFGLVGIAILAISMLETFSNTGFQFALIQKKNNIRPYLDTAWTISALRGLVLFIILFICAPLIASFFNSSQALLVIRITAISMIITGFQNIGIIFYQKELEFNKLFKYEIFSTIAQFTGTVILAFAFRNVWALIFGNIIATFARFCLSYILHSYRPKFKVEKDKVLELFGFGKWVLLSSVVIFFARQGDDLFLGKVLGITALGFYQMAFLIGNIPSSEITGIISKVAFPTYSKIIDDSRKLTEAYLKTLAIVFFVSLPLTGGIIVLAQPFTSIFLGDKWLPIVLLLKILALSGILRSIIGTGGAIFNAIGKPRFDFTMNLIRLFAIGISIYPLTHFLDMAGTCLSVLFSLIIASFYWLYKSMKEIKIEIRQLWEIIYPSLIITTFMCLVIYSAAFNPIIFCSDYVRFFLCVFIGISIYFGGIWILGKTTGINTLGAFKFIITNLKP